MKLYLAGPITHNPNFKEQFNTAAEKHRELGRTVINPAELPPGLEQHEYMHICYAMIDVCEALLFLKGWENSDGARAEHAYAKRVKKKILYEFN